MQIRNGENFAWYLRVGDEPAQLSEKWNRFVWNNV